MQRHGRGGPGPTARYPSPHRGLPVRHRRAAPLVGDLAMVRVLRGGLLLLRRVRAQRHGAAVVVRGGGADGARGQARRAVVAAPGHAVRPGLPAYHAALAHVGAARGAQLRAVPAGRVHPEPSPADAAPGAGGGRPGVRAPGSGSAPLLPLRAAQPDADHHLHDRHRHSLHALGRRGVPRRAPRRGVDGGPGSAGGRARVRGRGAAGRGGDRAPQRGHRTPEQVRRGCAAVRAHGSVVRAGHHLPWRAQQRHHIESSSGTAT
jgi:hypothetical protein